MSLALTLPRLLFGSGALGSLSVELRFLGVTCPLLISDRGLEAAGIVKRVKEAASEIAVAYLDVPENPTALGASRAMEVYRAGACDGVVALGGGSVLDTAKMVAALAADQLLDPVDIIGRPDSISAVVPLLTIPTTVGTGSESSPVAALHLVAGGPAIGTRHHLLVPRVAICDPDVVRTLPRNLVAATAIDALSHCLEGYFAEPAHPVIDALAIDGISRVFADVHAALTPEGDVARGSLMAAAFAGGAAIHKGLGPAHAVALACGDQDVHHGTLIGVALAATTRLLARHSPGKAAKVVQAIGLQRDADLAQSISSLIASLSLPTTLSEAGYQFGDRDSLIDSMVASPFNRTSPYVPLRDEYAELVAAMA